MSKTKKRKPKKPLYWATSGYYTDSGERAGIFLWRKEPTHSQVEKAYQALYPIEYNDGGSIRWETEVIYRSAIFTP